MAKQRMKARDKKVQKMTRDGLVEENLTDNSSVRVSKRAGDMKMERKAHTGRDERVGGGRSMQQSRDAPGGRRQGRNRSQIRDVSGKTNNYNGNADKEERFNGNTVKRKRRPAMKAESGGRLKQENPESSGKAKTTKYQTKKKIAGQGKLQEKERQLSTSRGDSRKEETGGTKRPQQKKRLQFAAEEIGAKDTAKIKEAKKEAAKDTYKAGIKKSAVRLHSQKGENVVHEADSIGRKKSKLSFEDAGNVAGRRKKPTGAAAVGAGVVAVKAYRKLTEGDDGNAAVQGTNALADGGTTLASVSVRSRNRRQIRKYRRTEARRDKEAVKALYQEALSKDQKLQRSSFLRKQIQKARIKREYAKAKRAEQSFGTAAKGTVDYIKKIGGKVTNFFVENKKVYLSLGLLLGMFFLISTCLVSCSALFFQNTIDYSGASYMSNDDAIREADLYYSRLEANLQERVNAIEIQNGGYDRYRYQIDEIGHDPFILISYLSSKYQIFEFDATIQAELDSLFAEQYSLSTESSTETITETRRVRVGESLGQVVTSGYCNCTICCGQWSGGPTASGVYPQANHTIAVDAHTPTVPMGTRVVMNGVEYTVEDTGNFTQYGVDFDVYYDSHQAASNHGHQTWEAFLADDNGSQEVEVTSTHTVTVFSVSLTNRSLSGICQNRLNSTQKQLFMAYNMTKGNLQMFESPFEFNWYYRISSYYGYRVHPITGANAMHNGMDISAAEGTSIAAGLTGTVSKSDYYDGYGNYVDITSDGYTIRYAHLSSRSVSAGDAIEYGDEIGKVGSTGTSTGPHLHLELFYGDERMNPLFYFETGSIMPGSDVEYSSEAARRLVEFALQFQGTPYVWGGYSPSGFDCSGFVSYCLTNSGVLNTGHQDCNGLLSMMTRIPESDLQPGDIVFFQGTYACEGASHVGIYIGNGEMVHSGHPNKISSIYSPYFQEHWLCAARW